LDLFHSTIFNYGTNADIYYLQNLNDNLKEKTNNYKIKTLDLKNINKNKKTMGAFIVLIIILLVTIGKFAIFNNDIESKPTLQNNLDVTSPNKNLENAVSYKNVIIFPDKDLEIVVRDSLKKPNGDILKGDVAKITKLQAPNANIKNLSGIQNFTNLTLLYLYNNNNNISNIDDLKGLTKLAVLDLGTNSITDYSLTSSYYNNLEDKDFILS